MGDSAEAPAQDDGSDPSGLNGVKVVDIVPDGDLILDVTFYTSKDVLQAARKAARKTVPSVPKELPQPTLRSTVRVAYRVHLAVLRQQSKYFDNLLGDKRFAEAKSIESALQRLSLQGIKPENASPTDLPVVKIHEDDETTRSVGREGIFEDLLRILHRKQSTTNTKHVSMHYLAVLAVLADRFASTGIVSRYVSALKYKWPATQTRLGKNDGPTLSRAAEETLRQKILVAWLLDQPPKLMTSTRELIMYGSRRWRTFGDEEDEEDEEVGHAAWWDLPDDLERELHYRRDCILNTLASIPRHFLRLYTSRTRQCSLGYDTSPACDSFQLGEMIKFFVSRDLLFLVDFSPHSLDTIRDFAATDLGHVIASLRQCPSYPLDKYHTSCGLRMRILPIVDFVQAMLSSSAVAIGRVSWLKAREATSWMPRDNGKREKRVFRFTRGIATDQRLRYEGAMATERIARELFTADEWDWTPEEDQGREEGMGRWRFG